MDTSESSERELTPTAELSESFKPSVIDEASIHIGMRLDEKYLDSDTACEVALSAIRPALAATCLRSNTDAAGFVSFVQEKRATNDSAARGWLSRLIRAHSKKGVTFASSLRLADAMLDYAVTLSVEEVEILFTAVRPEEFSG